jgi:co-chaperonin GroES (HSP10)
MSEGIRLDRKTTEVLGAGERLRMLRDHLLVEVLPWTPSSTIEVIDDTRKPLRGIVVAKGPGCYPKRYNKDRSKTWDSKAFRPTDVNLGDQVELGGLEIDGYAFQRLMVNGKDCVLCREEDVAGIVE